MKNYIVEPVQIADEFVWCVWESKTGQVIKNFFFQDEAEEYGRFLNRGGAFDGNTPPFILQNVDIKKLNQSFQTSFK